MNKFSMRSIIAATLSLCLITGAHADSLGSAAGGQPANQSNLSGGVCQSSPIALSNGQQASLLIDCTTHALITEDSGTGGTITANQGTPNAGGANAWPVISNPSAASTAGVAPVQSASVETGHVIKNAAGNLYDFNVSADATLAAAQWEVLIFNSTTVPSSGAVTPVKCYIVPAGVTSVSGAFPTPLYLGTGISIAVSTAATCFTKTDSAHGFISANAQ